MKRILFSILSLSLFAGFSVPTMALTFEAAENVVIDEQINDDAYVFGGNVEVNSDVAGDLYVAGGQVLINGRVMEDLVVAGGKVTINGDVLGDLRVSGGQVFVFGNVGDDVLAAGGQIDVAPASVISGTVVAGAGVMTIDGTVKEELRGVLSALILNGVVEDDVVVTIENQITFGENARIAGDLNYSSLTEGTVPHGVVAGEVHFNKFEQESLSEQLAQVFLTQKILSFFAALILLLLVVLLAPRFLSKAGELTKSNVVRSLLIGFFSVIGVIVGFVLLIATVVGVPFALLALAAAVIIFYFSKIAVAAWISTYFLNYKKKVSKAKMAAVMSFILLAYYVVSLIPFIGWLINLLLFFIGIGTIVLMKAEYLKFLKGKKML